MYELKKRNSISPLKNSVRGRPLGKESQFNLGYILIIGVIIIFLIRAIGVINSHSEIGVYAYVKMLNIGMPIVETQVYKEEDYSKNKVPIKSIVSEALGLANINLLGIIGNEISYFSGAEIDNTGVSDHSKGFDKFQVSENTIAKLTPEEIAELNDVSKAYNPSIKKTLNSSKPEVLIYHTHTMEQYSESGESQTENSDVNVVGVGDILTKELEEGYGISVVHDKTNYTLPDYPTAYDRSREGLKKYLDEFGDFKLVIDLHRDSGPRSSVVANLNNQSLAKFMFVLSENVPTYDTNKKVAEDLYGIGYNLFPELIKENSIVKPGGINGYNQGFSEGSMIIEVGSHNNTAQEAKLTAKYIARILAEYLNGSE